MATVSNNYVEEFIDTPAADRTWTRQDSNVIDLEARRVTATERSSAGEQVSLTKRAYLTGDFYYQNKRSNPNHEAIERQVDELRNHAREETEAFSEASAAETLRFCHELAADVEPAIFLMANGNLRAVWRNQELDQIGIQFMSNGVIQYVILRDRNGMTLKALGEDVDPGNIRVIVKLHSLARLWFHGQG